MKWWFKCLFTISSETIPFLKTLDEVGIAFAPKGHLLKSPRKVVKEVIRCIPIFQFLQKEVGAIGNKMKSFRIGVF